VNIDDDAFTGEGTGDRHGRWTRVPGPPLSPAQERVLLSLVTLCPQTRDEAKLRPIAEGASLAPGPATLALGGLVRRRMANRHDDGDGAVTWTPTNAGRSEADVVRPGDVPRT
jgi:hypothetical protein